MSPRRQRIFVGSLLVSAAAVLTLLLTGGEAGPRVQAEFTSARGLLEGNEVRVQGAPAGTVERIELTDRNTALATLRLDDGLEAPRADATAAIRPVDLLGDVYLSLSPGRDPEPLRGPIPPVATSNAPRLTDLLSVFRPNVGRGLEALFVELGLGVERRGVDISRAAIALRPGLEATDELMTELGSQRAGLRELIADARRMTSQVATRDRELGGLVDGVATTLRTTAGRSRALDRGLAAMPALLGRLGRTSRGLTETARAATPLARSLRTTAPQLGLTTRTLAPFLAETERAIEPTRPLVRRLDTFLDAGRPTFQNLSTGLRTLRGAAPDLQSLVAALIPAASPISDGFFVNFADQAAEPGTQPFDPFADPARRYWRGAAVFSCEAFGVKIAPNCLDQFLDTPAKGRARRERDRSPTSAAPPVTAAPKRAPAPPERPRLPLPRLPELPELPRLPGVPGPVQDIVDGALGRDGVRQQPRDGATEILDFLLGP